MDRFFIEFFAPAICAACASFGGVQGGVSLGPVDIGIGSINRRQSDGQIEHDTMFISASTALWRKERYSAGIFAAGSFNPTPEGGPRSVQAGPYGEMQLKWGLAARLHILPTQAWFSLLWRH